MDLLVILFVVCQETLKELDDLAEFFCGKLAIQKMDSAKLIQQFFLKLGQRLD